MLGDINAEKVSKLGLCYTVVLTKEGHCQGPNNSCDTSMSESPGVPSEREAMYYNSERNSIPTE